MSGPGPILGAVEAAVWTLVAILGAFSLGVLTLLTAQHARLDARLDAMNARIDGLEARIDQLASRMDGLTTRMDDVVAAVRDAVATLGERVARHEREGHGA
jgi:cell division protein FtsB